MGWMCRFWNKMGEILGMRWAAKEAREERNIFIHRRKRACFAPLAVSGFLLVRPYDKKGRNMSQKTPLECSQKCWSSTIAQVLRSLIVKLVLLVLLATPTLLVGTSWQAHANTLVPTHVSMQAGVRRDRTPGRPQQLCFTASGRSFSGSERCDFSGSGK
jgi:hypothetical protein